jgi:anti-anti-sigma factor
MRRGVTQVTTSSDLPIEYAKDAVVVTFPAEVDLANADIVRTTLLQVLSRGAPAIIVDMVGCQFCDSSGIKALMHAHTRAAALGVPVRIAAPRKGVLRVLDVAGVTRVIPVLEGNRPVQPQPPPDGATGPSS